MSDLNKWALKASEMEPSTMAVQEQEIPREIRLILEAMASQWEKTCALTERLGPVLCGGTEGVDPIVAADGVVTKFGTLLWEIRQKVLQTNRALVDILDRLAL